MQRIRNILTITLLAVAFSLASGSFVAVSAQQTDPPGADVGPGQLGDNIDSENADAMSASTRVAAVTDSMQGALDRTENRVKPSSKASAEKRVKPASKAPVQKVVKPNSKASVEPRQQLRSKLSDRKADWALDTQALR
jgi:hypothetical protein